MEFAWYVIYDGNPIEVYHTSAKISKDDLLYAFAEDYDFATDRAMICGRWYDTRDLEVLLV